MKLEIELDLNKIDYDSINKQLAEKVAELNLKEEYDIKFKIDSKINSLLHSEIRDCYNNYLDNYITDYREKTYSTSKGYEVINNISKEKIEEFAEEYIDKFLEKIREDETLKETISYLLPSIFSTVLFSNIQNYLGSIESKAYDNNFKLIENKIHLAFDDLKYRL